MAPAIPSSVATLAELYKLANLGKATAARIPKITITTTNSIKVKPDAFFI